MKPVKYFCKRCGEEVEKDTNECHCGSRCFIFGNIDIINKNIVCECDELQATFISHVNMTDIHLISYKCQGCNASITMETYIEDYPEVY